MTWLFLQCVTSVGEINRLLMTGIGSCECSLVAYSFRNRFSVGVIKEFNKQLAGELFYLRQNDGRARPGNLHVIGTTLRIRLRKE